MQDNIADVAKLLAEKKLSMAVDDTVRTELLALFPLVDEMKLMIFGDEDLIVFKFII